jgi:hypothetical protein
MRPLTAQELLRVWEVGVGKSSLDRALTILQMAFPAVSRDALAALSIGQRNARLFRLREQTFGARLDGLAECPECKAQLEFSLVTADIVSATDEASDQSGDESSSDEIQPSNGAIHEAASDGWQLRFRLPNSVDLAAIAQCADTSSARRLLVERCLAQAIHNGAEVSAPTLSETAIAELANQMAARDPHATLELELQCSACDARWLLDFDIESFFWNEIAAQAKRLLREVHLLARAYGWREAEILAMSAARRQMYLEMIGG